MLLPTNVPGRKAACSIQRLAEATPIGNLLSDLSVKFFCVSCGYSNKQHSPEAPVEFVWRYGFAWVTGALFFITLSGHWIFG